MIYFHKAQLIREGKSSFSELDTLIYWVWSPLRFCPCIRLPNLEACTGTRCCLLGSQHQSVKQGDGVTWQASGIAGRDVVLRPNIYDTFTKCCCTFREYVTFYEMDRLQISNGHSQHMAVQTVNCWNGCLTALGEWWLPPSPLLWNYASLIS